MHATMKNGKWREHISCILYVLAFFAFLGGITAESRGSMLDFSSLARWLCCGFAAICVITGAIIWKAKDARGKKIKIGIMIGALVVIVAGGIIDSMTDNTSAVEYDELQQGDNNMQYFFTAKVIEVDEEYLLLEVFDIGNTNLSDGEAVEVSTEVVAAKGCPEFVVDEYARVLLARNTDDNNSGRLEALSIYKTDETGKVMAD